MTVKDWCEAQGISVKTFYYRLKVLRRNLPKENDVHEIVPIKAHEEKMSITKSTQHNDITNVDVPRVSPAVGDGSQPARSVLLPCGNVCHWQTAPSLGGGFHTSVGDGSQPQELKLHDVC